MTEPEPKQPQYRWFVQVKQRDHYGERYVSSTPAVFIATDKRDVDQQMRKAFNAHFDTFRKFWSHTWVLERMEAV